MFFLFLHTLFLIDIFQISQAIRNHMPGANKKVTYTLTNLQLKAAGLFKYVRPFCYHQAL